MTDARKVYADVYFDSVSNENYEYFSDRQELAYKYFYHLNKSSKILNDIKALNALNYTYVNAIEFKKLEQISLGLTYDFDKILISIIENCYQRLIECIYFKEDDDLNNDDVVIDRKIENEDEKENVVSDKFEINKRNRIGTLSTSLISIGILDRFTYYSPKFSNKFLENKGIKSLFTLINNRKIQGYFATLRLMEQKSNKTDNQEYVLMKGILKAIFSSMVNLARHSHFNLRNTWKDLKELLAFFLNEKKINNIFDINAYIYITLAYLIDETNAHEYFIDENDNQHILKNLVKLIGSIANELYTNRTSNKRIKVKFDADRDAKHVSYMSKSGLIFNIIDIIRVLYKLAQLNDQFKNLLYFKYNLKTYLKQIILKSTETELEFSLDLLWVMCYHKAIALDVYNDKNLFGFINNLLKNTSLSNKFLKKCLFGILWLIEEKIGTYAPKSITHNLNQVVIICQHDLENDYENRQVCYYIEKELDKFGYQVWYDINDTFYQNNIDLVRNQIKTSYWVLFIINKNYTHNTALRNEIEYSLSLNKHVIPLMMSPLNLMQINEWLANSLRRTRISFNFFKHQYNICFNGIIDYMQEIQDSIISSDSGDNFQEPVNKLPISFDWDEKQTDEWLKTKKIHKDLVQTITPCNGKLLYEYWLIIQEAPDYFYEVCSKNKLININEDVSDSKSPPNRSSTEEDNKGSSLSQSINLDNIKMIDFSLLKKELDDLFKT